VAAGDDVEVERPSVSSGRAYPSRSATSASAPARRGRDARRHALQPRHLGAGARAQRLEQLPLARLDALGGGEHLLLVLLERRVT
jgi:hypothetical protein